jgi:hypothetical protein
MSATDELTICSVSYRSRRWLELNRELTRRLNPGARLRWVVAENSPADSPERLPLHDDGELEVIEGAPVPQVAYGAASYHHGAGLDLTLPRIATRFALFLDPDFFIVRERWVGELLGHAREQKLALFGAPWHPGRLRKLRYFPCAHCLLVDLEQLPPASLDFAPGFDDPAAYAQSKGRGKRSALRKLDPLGIARRRTIGTSRDTGWRIYERWRREPALRVECLQPVFRPAHWRMWLERPLPDRLRLVPGRPGAFSERGFRELGWPDLASLDWEEFMWRGAPFAFHVRSHPKRRDPAALEGHYARVRALVDGLAQPTPAPGGIR